MTAGLTPQVYEHDGAVYADSRDVAAFFGKQHKNVLQAVDNLLETNKADFSAKAWFTERTEARPADNSGRPFRRFELTKDGFTLLAMGFTGEKALAFKIAYRCDRQEARSRHPSSRSERTTLMTRRLRNWLRSAIGLALVILSAILVPVFDLETDDRENSR